MKEEKTRERKQSEKENIENHRNYNSSMGVNDHSGLRNNRHGK